MCIVSTGLVPIQAQDVRQIFVTSTSGTSEFATWPDADDQSGLAGADQICRTRAAAADLPGADQFVAWLSDSADDAYCRVHGLSGKRADNCGQASLPASAGPWLRRDGFPFAGPIQANPLRALEVLAPVRFDESGNETSGSYFTGTNGRNGVANSADFLCNEWSSTAVGAVNIGDIGATGIAWSNGGTGSCNSTRRLLCMRPGSGPPLGNFQQQGALAFVSVSEGPGDLSAWAGANGEQGTAAGDAVCQADAASHGFDNPTRFKAWLSDSGSNAIDRLATNGPWVRPDGVPVAQSKSELASGELFAPLNVNPLGNYQGNQTVWTGTNPQGMGTSSNCGGWSGAAANLSGDIGITDRSSSRWTSGFGPQTCDRNGVLYCFEDAAPSVAGCVGDDDTLCLGAGRRFAVEIDWQTATGSGTGAAVEIGRQDSGLFTFFDPNNLELLVKVLDGCGINNHYWVFYGATTDVAFQLTVDDTVTQTRREYSNPLGMSAEPIKDLEAFPCTP
jgi:hypothetical protein